MSDRIGFTDIRDWRSLTSSTKRTIGSIDADFSVEFSVTTLQEITQLTEIIEELNAAVKRYCEVAIRDVEKMNTACERIEQRDREFRDAWGTMR